MRMVYQFLTCMSIFVPCLLASLPVVLPIMQLYGISYLTKWAAEMCVARNHYSTSSDTNLLQASIQDRKTGGESPPKDIYSGVYRMGKRASGSTDGLELGGEYIPIASRLYYLPQHADRPSRTS